MTMPARFLRWIAVPALSLTIGVIASELRAADAVNTPKGEPGILPVGESGKPLNLDFERGNLDDWTVEGDAFKDQPIKGPINPKRIFGEGKRSDHTGNFWLGGFEKLQDPPKGTLTSAPFKVTHPFASFLIGGGAHKETRVELATAEDNKVFYTASGKNEENMRPVVVELEKLIGKTIFVRVVDDRNDGWGHVNFDDFRFHSKRPEFHQPSPVDPQFAQIYPFAGLDAAAAAKAMVVPPEFTVQVGAAEPDVRQPIAMTIDHRGRVWVAEAFTYPNRAPEGQGKDRIVILEDTDQNGTLDKRTVFAEKLNLVSGIEVGFGGLFVGAAPYLLFIPDRDHDDKPDAEPEILLDGWGYQDTHETLNAFIWGPDGWLYGCHGVFTHSNVGKPGAPESERTKINAGIWRYHPIRKQFEVFSEGTSNPWGLDFDDHGQAVITACVIPHLYHMIQGARYERQAGNHFNPHTYADIKTIADHFHYTGNQWNNADRRQSDSLGGGHAHAGAMIYLGGSWPEKYRESILMSNIHGNRINTDYLRRDGSGFVGSHGDDFLLTGDQWSQMLYLRYGPDGQVWILDWYDANQCHRREEEVHDRSNGRIYRVAYRNAPNVKVDLESATDLQLAEHQSSKNDWFVRMARRILQHRAASGKLAPDAIQHLRELASTAKDDRVRLRGMWALHVTGNLPLDLIRTALQDASESVRAWAIQLALETPQFVADASLLQHLTDMAKKDDSPRVRLYLASGLQRLPLEKRWDILAGLGDHADDAADHNLPLLIWYASEPLASVDAKRALAWALSAGNQIPLLSEFMIRRIGSSQQSLAILVDALGSASQADSQLTFLRGINQALKGARQVKAPESWGEVSRKLGTSDNGEVQFQTTLLDVRFGLAAGTDRLLALVADAKAPLARRQTGLTQLVQLGDARVPALLRKIVEEESAAAGNKSGGPASGSILSSAIRGLAAFDDAETAPTLLTRYAALRPELQRDVLATLCGRIASAQQLLAAIQRKQIPASHLTADLVRQLRNLENADLNAEVEKVWGTVRESDADKKQQITRTKAVVEQQGRVPDMELGRTVFAKTCQQCHTLFGTGGKVGPDLTGSNRANLDYLLSNIHDPSAVMAKEYQPTILVTASGQTITGIIKETTANAVMVQTSNELLELAKDDIETQKLSEKSMMPEDLLRPLTTHEVRSLVAYLGSSKQTPLLATPDTIKNFFNGKDLTGWVGDPELWSGEDGQIVGKTTGLKHNAFLFSELAVEDFRLTVEVKLTPDAENSGIQFRSEPVANGEIKGYQADIGKGWWGKLYEELGRGLIWKESGEKHVRENDWNRYEIVAIGSRIRTSINGQPCVELDDPTGARRGVIAFQLHSGGALEVRFRNLQLVDLTRRDALHAAYRTSAGGATAAAEIGFRKRQLEPIFRSEGVAYGDFNNDGRLDIAAGSVWFEAPEWKQRPVLAMPKQFSPKEYSDTFCNWAEDVDGDGKQDLIVVDFPGKPTRWFRNPGKEGEAWEANLMTPTTNNESPAYIDVDRDGQRELVLGFSGKRLGFARRGGTASSEWALTAVSSANAPGTDPFSHGLGIGDINGDGRDDVLVTAGWWEAPAATQKGEWKFHAVNFGEPAAQMYVFDFDGDGDADVLSSSAHRRGIWWHEQLGDDKWETHEVDASIAQTHAMCLADINGDGLPDFVTGKRYYAHNGRDPGEDEPPVITWFELTRDAGRPKWIPHQIDHDSGVGTQFEVIDMNSDGLLDVIVSNKKGTFYFEQTRKAPSTASR